uniref:Putative group i salivary lipocalin n=1 Tax=Rhipicephalus pulchellus TaxID=72859 RepID=L7LQW6_RHIPC
MRAEAFFLVFVLFVHVHGAPLKDLIDALNTTKPIWLYKQSYQHSPEAPGRTCVRWNKIDLSNSSYIFYNSFKRNGDYHTDENMHAKLTEMSRTGVMEVDYKREGGESQHVFYTLDEWHPNEKCFILTRSIDGRNYECELHLWHQQLQRNHAKCDARYREICGEGPEVFSDDGCL